MGNDRVAVFTDSTVTISMRRSVLISVCLAGLTFATSPRAVEAQRETRENTNGWFSWFGDVELSERWSIDFDASLRLSGPYSEVGQELGRVSLRRTISPNVRVAAGVAGSDTHPYGALPIAFRTPEFRTFQHVQLFHAAHRVQFTHRYRLEQRWTGRVALEDGEESVQNWVRTGRMRYLARATLPLRGETLDPGEWFVSVGNEVFLNFGANIQQNVFDQNRLQLTLGRRLGDGVRLEVGYLDHLVLRPSGREVERNHTLLTVLTTSFHRRRGG